jgi:hypothetical protein
LGFFGGEFTASTLTSGAVAVGAEERFAFESPCGCTAETGCLECEFGIGGGVSLHDDDDDA